MYMSVYDRLLHIYEKKGKKFAFFKNILGYIKTYRRKSITVISTSVKELMNEYSNNTI